MGLARTSITNIEKGRQQVSLHLFLALAAAVRTDPSELTPNVVDVAPRAKVPDDLLNGLASADQDWVRRVIVNDGQSGGVEHGRSGGEGTDSASGDGG